MHDFELIIEAPIEEGPRPSAPTSGIFTAEVSYVGRPGSSLVPARPSVTPSRGPGPVARGSAGGRGSFAPRPLRTPVPSTGTRSPPARTGSGPRGHSVPAPTGVATQSLRPQAGQPNALQLSAPTSPYPGVQPHPGGSLSPLRASGTGRPTVIPQPSHAPRARPPAPRFTPASMALASLAPAERLSWAPTQGDAAARRAHALAQLSEDLVTARLIAAVPRTEARAVLAALAPLDDGFLATCRTLIQLYESCGAPHLLNVVFGIAELAKHTGRLQAAADIYRALHEATGDPELEIRAADALAGM